MPSLSTLNEFQSSFNNIANEKNDILAKKLPFDDFPLPDKEAPPIEFPKREHSADIFDIFSDDSSDDDASDDDDTSEDTDDASDDISGASPEVSTGTKAPGDFDFNAFFGNTPGDVTPHSLDDPPSIDDLFQDTSLSPSPSDETPAAAPLETTEAETDLPDFDNLDFGAEDTVHSDAIPTDDGSQDAVSPDDGSLDTTLEESGSIDLGGESPDIDFNAGTETDDLPETEPPKADDGQDLPDFDLPETEPPKTDDSQDLPDFDLPEADFGTPEEDTPSPDDDEGSIDMGGESLEFTEKEADNGFFDGNKNADADIDSDNSLPDMDFPASDADTGFDDFLPDTDFPASDADTGFDSSLPDMDFPDGDMDTGFDSPPPDTDFPAPDMDTSFDNPLPDTDFPSSDTDTGFESPLPDTAFDLGGEAADFNLGEGDGSTPESGDTPEIPDFGSDFASDSIDLESEPDFQSTDGADDVSSESFGSDDFALPGLEEIFDKSKVKEISQPEQKKGFFKKRKEAKVEVPETDEGDTNIEELQLSQNDMDKMLKTLAAYPINLRIACEELIAEHVLEPQQLSKLIKMLINGAYAREMAAFAKELLGREIVIPKSFEKMSGAAFEAEQSSFAYIFVHNFLPVLRLFAIIAAFAASVFYLGYRFVYIPVKAESIYKRGYERIPAGEYQRANQLFNEAFVTHKKKKWFYLYAESFRDHRRYLLAEEKYDELLRNYPRDKKGVLDYSRLETNYLMNYDKANNLLQRQLLDYAPNDPDGLLAAGDNFLLWADSDPSRFYDKYEDARFSYARLLELYGWTVPVVERMLKYFIRTDNLKEVLYLRIWFENDPKNRRLSTPSLAELGGYLLDKQLEEVKGVPDPYLESIESVRAMLLQAVMEDQNLPEPHYHLARYYNNLGNTYEERLTLENAIRAFDLAQTESVRRRNYRVDTHLRYANLLINNREFFPAEEQLVKGIELYEDFMSRNLIPASPQLGRLYAAKGDLEYFVKSGDMRAALNDYNLAERYGYAPPEIQYRMGSAYYHLQDWGNSLNYLFRASTELPLNRRILYALGNVTYQRGDYYAAQGYYDRLLGILEVQRIRLPVLLPNDNAQFLELGERLMMARNNAGVVYEALANQSGNNNYRSTALALYAESARAWDAITRNPETMVRMRLTDSSGAPGINLGYLNAGNAMRPSSNYSPEIFVRIDKDVLEPSLWEELAPFGGLQ